MPSKNSKNELSHTSTAGLNGSWNHICDDGKALSCHDLQMEMEKRKIFLKQVAAESKKGLLNAPEGELRFNRHGNSVQYYCRYDPKDTSGKYIRKKDRKLAAALAQKDYDRKVLKQASEELLCLQQAIKKLNSCGVEGIYEKLPVERRCLIKPIVITDEQFIEQWMSAVYTKKKFPEDAPEYYTAKGERVRSKTEIIIADTLNRMQVPYIYEFPVNLRGFGTVHPDFTVLNIRLRKTYCWEHLGMMDDPEYAADALRKINAYIRNGYLPGENLIITHETGEDPIQTRLIEKYIVHYLK